ncbi:MAG: TonB-dependent receptor plug domain-containing protein [Chitinophagales bacterium]|nr:TonB-dependent receptor [Chitinophagales bacterium]MDW8274205.1 TonB-dependent receptor plug domain-containing protein [Chitinophagales bacterium]
MIKHLIWAILSASLTATLHAQQLFDIKFKILEQSDEEEPLKDVVASIAGTGFYARSGSDGKIEFSGIPAGNYIIQFELEGYFTKRIKRNISVSDSVYQIIFLEPREAELEAVTIVTSRNLMRVEESAIPIDVVGYDEMTERSIDKPSSISHALREQQGVQVQRTSATLGTFNIRLLGLNGKYTQLLKDGFATFGSMSSGINIAQIPPLDLQQIEIIKGPASTLYGGDAIAGVVNLISKKPIEGIVERDILFNIENTRSLDAGVYLREKIKWFGYTFSGLYRNQRERDWDNDNFVEYPKINRAFVSPKFFFDLSKNVRLMVGGQYTYEERTGGALPYIKGRNDSIYNYFENNISHQGISNLLLEVNFGDKGNLNLRQCINYFRRKIFLPEYVFHGIQLSGVSEVNYTLTRKNHRVVVGLDLRNDRFTDKIKDTFPERDYLYITTGLFSQYTLQLKRGASIETGLRLDYNIQKGFFPLPFLSYKQVWNKYFTTRLVGGMGYKLPTIFQGESEEFNFRNVRSLPSTAQPELSAGGGLHWFAPLPNFNGVNITLSQQWFYTHIFRPLMPQIRPIQNCITLFCDELAFVNSTGNIETKGVETRFQIYYRGFNFSGGYTFTHHTFTEKNKTTKMPITAPHQVSLLAGYELFRKFSTGIDAYYFSPQFRSDGSLTPPVWEVGINTQLDLKYVIVFANIENILDIRQSKFEKLAIPYPTFKNPRFAEVYAPLESTIFNVGCKAMLGKINRKTEADND